MALFPKYASSLYPGLFLRGYQRPAPQSLGRTNAKISSLMLFKFRSMDGRLTVRSGEVQGNFLIMNGLCATINQTSSNFNLFLSADPRGNNNIVLLAGFHYCNDLFLYSRGNSIARLCKVWGLTIIWLVIRAVIRRYWTPIRDIPGPFVASFSKLWQVYHLWKGHGEEELIELHKKHGKSIPIPLLFILLHPRQGTLFA
jgi:hypothetical protein